jgi:hypothetical protein
LVLALPWFRSFQFRRQYRKMPMLRDRRTLSVDDTILLSSTADSESRTTWSAYTRFGEDKKTFVLFVQGNRVFIPFPKRELTSLQVDELRSLFETHLSAK